MRREVRYGCDTEITLRIGSVLMTRDSPLVVLPLYAASLVGGYYAVRYLFGSFWLNAFVALVGGQVFGCLLYLRDLRRKAARQNIVVADNDKPSDP